MPPPELQGSPATRSQEDWRLASFLPRGLGSSLQAGRARASVSFQVGPRERPQHSCQWLWVLSGPSTQSPSPPCHGAMEPSWINCKAALTEGRAGPGGSPTLGQDGVEGLPWTQVPKASEEGLELGHSQCGHLETQCLPGPEGTSAARLSTQTAPSTVPSSAQSPQHSTGQVKSLSLLPLPPTLLMMASGSCSLCWWGGICLLAVSLERSPKLRSPKTPLRVRFKGKGRGVAP